LQIRLCIPCEEAIANRCAGGYFDRVLIEKLQLWMDPVLRSGPEAMAVDEWLLETVTLPVLRIYVWQGEWASIGYFGEIAAARAAFPGVDLVRRWTGGGMVDHRADWTYTLVAPQSEALASCRGAESYRRIHSALRETLLTEGIDARMSAGEDETGAALCFENPVHHDLLGPDDRKLAGAGQRRSRQGLLHQGSVSSPCTDHAISQKRSEDFAGRLAGEWQKLSLLPDPENLARRMAARYTREVWTSRR
jgi:lipoate-protein ligase A